MCKSKYSAAVREHVVKESRCCPYCHGTGKVEDEHLSVSKDITFTGNDASSTNSSNTIIDANTKADE